jgi:hypothetical protein
VGQLDETSAAVTRAAGLVVALGAAVFCTGHVGSPDTWFEGMAGPYPVRIVIRAPGVIPGLAEITVRVQADGVERVTAAPVIWNAGEGGAPPPDVAAPVPGDSHLYSVQLWFMQVSSYSVRVTVAGARGSGVALVPFQAVASGRRPFDRALAVGLSLAGIVLFFGAVTLIGAATREAVVPPGEEPDQRRRWLARGAMAGTAVLLGLVLLGGRAWWNTVDAEYARSLYRPFAARAAVLSGADGPTLSFEIVDSLWRARSWTPLIPDHGKLMHLFLIRDSLGEGFAHLHPVAQDSNSFETWIPPLPAGRYRVYADIVHESGFAQTLLASVVLHGDARGALPSRGAAASDPDDAWFRGPLAPGDSVRLDDGTRMVWEKGTGPLVADQDARLRFSLHGPDGKPADLEPYMGMMGHAIVERTDGAVFCHLHPMGTPAMASQLAVELRDPTDTVRGDLGRRLAASPGLMPSGMMHPMVPGRVSFPYAFPRPGTYRVWVQVKRGDRILTGGFRAEVGT